LDIKDDNSLVRHFPLLLLLLLFGSGVFGTLGDITDTSACAVDFAQPA